MHVHIHVSACEAGDARSSGARDLTPSLIILMGVCDVRLAIDSHIFCNYVHRFWVVDCEFV